MSERKWTLVVMGHGRWPYLTAATTGWSASLDIEEFDRTILALDGCEHAPSPVSHHFTHTVTTGPERKGLTANMAQALGALTPEDDWVFWVEEDFLIRDAPLDAMADTLEANPHVANMVLLRQPWGAHEIAAGSVYDAQPYDLVDRGGWLEHEGGFWLNPFVARASFLRTLQAGVESDLTAQCLARGMTFGYWGGRDDEPRCQHIGFSGGMGSEGWTA